LEAITERHILKEQKCPESMRSDLEKLLKRVNNLQELYGQKFVVTSGFRSLAHHIAIYHRKGITDPKKIPMKSKHLFCQAVDLEDKDGRLYKWVQQNEKYLEDIGLWYELGTKGWVHLQILPPASGRRGFLP
jgi:uncharacterized protein YcbK (DUF882 family)